jgi:hypothetical protein
MNDGIKLVLVTDYQYVKAMLLRAGVEFRYDDTSLELLSGRQFVFHTNGSLKGFDESTDDKDRYE